MTNNLETHKCFKCEKEIPPGKERLAYNLPGIGTFYFCRECESLATTEEIIKQFERFFNPPKKVKK